MSCLFKINCIISHCTVKPLLCRHQIVFMRALATSYHLLVEESSINHSKEQEKSEKRMEEIKKNVYYAKYAEKLKQKYSICPEVFQKFAEEKSQSKTSHVETRVPASHSQSPQNSIKESRQSKRLDDIVKLDLLREKSSDEIREIWTRYHREKCSSEILSAVVEKLFYERMMQRAGKYPTFLYPVPRSKSGGYEFMLGQFSDTDCYFTPLIAYQSHAENAPVCLTLHHFTDLLTDRGIVLLRVEIDTDILSPLEAQCVVNQVQIYYGGGGGGGTGEDGEQSVVRERLLEEFTNSPQDFDYRKLIQQVEGMASSVVAGTSCAQH